MTTPNFTHLHVHSYFSLLEGLIEPARLVQTAREQGLSSLALTDTLNLSGSVEFTQACQKAGIDPILGLEVNMTMPASLANPLTSAWIGPLVLLATDTSGWGSLCGLTAALLDQPEHDASTPISLERLADFSKGLICLSGGRRSLFSQLLRAREDFTAVSWLHEVETLFPGCFYVQLERHQPEDEQITRLQAEIASREHLPIVASHDIFYLQAGQEELQRTLTAIRLNRPLDRLRPEEHLSPASYFPSPADLSRRFLDLPGALAATQEIASRCRFTLPLGVQHFPRMSLPKDTSPAAVLRAKAEAGARRLYGSLSEEVQARLDHELTVINASGFEPIFLIMEEIIAFARRAGVPVSSRGSAASSLVAHCLGITSPDPLRLNLYFERFLNPARATPPDIDTDLCSRRRNQVIQHVFETYGQGQVAMVGTINRFRPRSALSDVAKAHGLTPEEIKKLSARMPNSYYFLRAQAPDEEEDAIPLSPFAELEPHFPTPRYQKIFRQAEAILGLPRHLSVHAGGIVITPDRLTNLLPVQRAAKGVLITQIDHKALEPMGIVKLDLLGIRGLTVLGDVSDALYSWRRSEYASPLDVLEDIPLEDSETSGRIMAGKTIGCFQIESPGMRGTLKEIHASSVEDIMVALALYRPGPLTGGLKDAFVRRHNHQEDVFHLHPALTSLLADTYGVILYQEQVLRIAHELAGFSLADSDLLRRAMSHFDPGKQMQTLKEKFISGAGRISAFDAETAQRVWELMAAFAGYGFPKAHAASYALVAWRSAWCKSHYPAEFMAAVLANWGGYYSQRVYLTEARRMGLRVRPPHINHARREFSVSYPDGNPVLYMGLDQVRGLMQRTQERILRLRPFASLEDFLTRVAPRREEAANLVRCGALEGLGSIPALLARLNTSPRQLGQMPLFIENDGMPGQPDWDLAEKVQAQEEILGIGVDAHPLELVAEKIQAAHAITTIEALQRNGERVRIAGVKQSSHRSRTGKGEMILFLSLEDLDGSLDVVFFSDRYQRYRALLGEGVPLLIEGIIEQEAGREEPVLRAEKVSRL